MYTLMRKDRGGREEDDEFPPRTKQFLFCFVFFKHMACRVSTSIIDISFLLCVYCGLKPHWGCQISKYSRPRAPGFTHRRLDIRATRIYMASACVFKNVNNFRHMTHTHTPLNRLSHWEHPGGKKVTTGCFHSHLLLLIYLRIILLNNSTYIFLDLFPSISQNIRIIPGVTCNIPQWFGVSWHPVPYG